MSGGGAAARWEVVTLRNGARAVRDAVLGEVMHPGVGPVAEAEALYVAQSRLAERLVDRDRGRDPDLERDLDPEPLVLFDVGLGAAANAAAAWRVSESAPAGARRLEIVSFERDLGALELALASAHADHLGLAGDAGDAARALLRRGSHRTPRTTWRLARGDLLDRLAAEGARAHLVFWDPFSPAASPELWTTAAFSALAARCRAGCLVFTYSASTAVRSALLLAGFHVGPGAPVGLKAQTTVARWPGAADDGMPLLDARWLARLERSSCPFPVDAPPDALARVRRHPQFR